MLKERFQAISAEMASIRKEQHAPEQAEKTTPAKSPVRGSQYHGWVTWTMSTICQIDGGVLGLDPSPHKSRGTVNADNTVTKMTAWSTKKQPDSTLETSSCHDFGSWYGAQSAHRIPCATCGNHHLFSLGSWMKAGHLWLLIMVCANIYGQVIIINCLVP